MMGLLPIIGRLYPAKAAETAVCTVAEAVKGAVIFPSTISYIILLGTTRCWVKSTGLPVEKTPAVPFASVPDPQWHGLSMMTGTTQVVVVNNSGVDKPHYWDGGAGVFAEITAAPKCKAITGWLGRLVCGAVYDTGAGTWYLNRLVTSKLDDITDFTDDTAVVQDLRDQGDVIQRFSVMQDNVLRIYRNRSIYFAYPTDDPYAPMQLPTFFTGRGLQAPSSLQKIGTFDIYLGEDDVYAFEAEPTGIGWPIRKELFALADPSRLQYAWSFVDATSKQYYLVVDLLDGTTRAYIYNYEERTWAQQDITGYTILASWYED